MDRPRAQGARFDSPVFAAGDTLLRDHLTLHGTGSRAGMTQSRRAIETCLFGTSNFPMEQWPVNLLAQQPLRLRSPIG